MDEMDPPMEGMGADEGDKMMEGMMEDEESKKKSDVVPPSSAPGKSMGIFSSFKLPPSDQES